MCVFGPTSDHVIAVQARGELSRSLEEKALERLELLFQELLQYRLKDGSFSYFTQYRPSIGSTWSVPATPGQYRQQREQVTIYKQSLSQN